MIETAQRDPRDLETAQRDPRELVAGVERLLEELETLADPLARAKAIEVAQGLLELYGAGLERIVETIADHDDGTMAAALSEDELVSHLLLLHGLHPVELEARVAGALDEVRPYLESHGGDVEVLEVEPPVVRLRLQGSCSGCPSSTMTLKLAIENAIRKAAPEIDEVVAQDGEGSQDPPLLQIELAGGPDAQPAIDGEWSMAGGLPELSGGGAVVKEVAGRRILFLKAADHLYGYRPQCPGCGEALDGEALGGTELRCGACANRYDVLRAGRCLDAPQLHLEPVPLLVGDDGLVKVALALPA